MGKVNKTALDVLIRRIERAPPSRFAMQRWFGNLSDNDCVRALVPECGTAACIAGWCLIASYGGEENVRLKGTAEVPLRAAQWLGLDDHNDVYKLFTPDCKWGNIILSWITKRQALHVLRRFRDTGIVDWSRVEATHRRWRIEGRRK